MLTVRQRHRLEEFDLYFSRRRKCITEIPYANACMLVLLESLLHEHLRVFVVIGTCDTPSSLSQSATS
jgi:hypothetical protein